jgi:hypothetical protein
MLGEYAPSGWAEIILAAARSPLGISALVILVVGSIVLALFRRQGRHTPNRLRFAVAVLR